MKIAGIVTVLGIILLYFVVMALKIDFFSVEMLIHSVIRFATGFIIFGVSVFYAHLIRFKSAIFLAMALVLADDVGDYFRQVDSFTPEVTLYSLYVLFWGSAMGYTFIKALKNN